MLYYLIIPWGCFKACGGLQSPSAWSHHPTQHHPPPSSPLSLHTCWSSLAQLGWNLFTGLSFKMRSEWCSWMPVITALSQEESGLLTLLNTADTHIHISIYTNTHAHTTGSQLVIMPASLAVHQNWCNHRAARSYCCQPHRGGHEQDTFSERTHPSCALLFQQSSDVWLQYKLISLGGNTHKGILLKVHFPILSSQNPRNCDFQYCHVKLQQNIFGTMNGKMTNKGDTALKLLPK